jgi:PTH1 family peptidyl-tRNA hydrolase
MSWLIVGLGNPGKAYADTRHNVGWLVLDQLESRMGAAFTRSFRFPARICEGSLGGHSALLVKPTTFMNRSGTAVSALSRKKGFRPEKTILVYDDMDLECGRIRLKAKGSAGGHNGIQSVIDSMGTNEFTRVRVGVGPRPKGEKLVEFVLSSFAPTDVPLVEDAVSRAADAIEHVLAAGLPSAMTTFNKDANT